MRLALGASRASLIRQLLTETLVLALLGGVAGTAVAAGLLDLVLGLDLPLPIPVTLDADVDGTVLAFTAGVSVLAGVLFGLAPAVRATDPDLASTLKSEGRTGSGRAGLRGVLVAGQVAFSLALLVGAGLLLRSVIARQDVDAGFGQRPSVVLTLQADREEHVTDAEVRRLWDAVDERLRRVEGVRSVGWTENLHLNPLTTLVARVGVPGVEPPPGRQFHTVDRAAVDDGFFEAAGIPLLEGRVLGPGDGPDAPPAVVVNEAFVERFWPGRSGVGRTVVVREEEATVVGVVGTARIRSLGEAPRPFIYESQERIPSSNATFVANATEPQRILPEAVREIRALDPGLRVWEAETMERHLALMTFPHRIAAIAAVAFAALALALAAIGLFGMVSFSVSRRTREVGIRMSLGAERGNVVRVLMGSSLRLVGLGGAAGMILGLVLARVLEGFLFGVPAFDPVTFVAVPAILGSIALVAAWWPAHRATRIDPVRALRTD